MIWPPPSSGSDRRIAAPVRRCGEVVRVELRVVRLWGRYVLIDDAGLVRCVGCWQLLPVEVLGATDNTHPVGLPFRAHGLLRDAPEGGLEDDVDPVPARWEMGW